MSAQFSSINHSEPQIHCLILISGDPRVDEGALEGLRCVLVLAGDTRWKITVGFCDKSVEFIRALVIQPKDSSLLVNPIIKQWSQSQGTWYCFFNQTGEDWRNFSASNIRILDADDWLKLGIAQSYIFVFG